MLTVLEVVDGTEPGGHKDQGKANLVSMDEVMEFPCSPTVTAFAGARDVRQSPQERIEVHHESPPNNFLPAHDTPRQTAIMPVAIAAQRKTM